MLSITGIASRGHRDYYFSADCSDEKSGGCHAFIFSRWRSWDVYKRQNKELYKAFNISAIPYVLVINDKKVVWTHSGYMPGNEVLVVDKALETIGKKWYSRENKTVLMAEKL